MRLLNAKTYELTEFHPGQIPKYAILSHTWGHEEVLYEDLKYTQPYLTLLYGAKQKRYRSKLGWQKIEYTCWQALEDNLSYVWVDTCCIDKTSSAELSEAINSMFLWYKRAVYCYVYLVDASGPGFLYELEKSNCRIPRWFSRGWTLQELIAPAQVIFWSSSWEYMGTKVWLRHLLSRLTGIDEKVLEGERDLGAVCVAQKMSWAAKRETTRPEDLAYCLLGIFGISMPPLYGEGERAFLRLQEEILKISDDHSLFAWLDTAWFNQPYGLLAKQPSCFAACSTTLSFRDWTNVDPSTTSNLGISLTLPIFSQGDGKFGAILNCAWDDDSMGRERVCLILQIVPGTVNQYQRISVTAKSATSRTTAEKTHMYIRQVPIRPSGFDVVLPPLRSLCHIDVGSKSRGINVTAYLHTGEATKSDDWYEALVDQNTQAVSRWNGAAFHIPETPNRLSVVFRVRGRMMKGSRGGVEEFFYVLLGSGARYDSHPAIVIMEDTGHIEALSAQRWDETSRILRDAQKTRGWQHFHYSHRHVSDSDSYKHFRQHFADLAELFTKQSASSPPFQKALSERYKTFDGHIAVSIRETPPENSARYEVAVDCSPIVQSSVPWQVSSRHELLEMESNDDGDTASSMNDLSPMSSVCYEETIDRSPVVHSPMPSQGSKSPETFRVEPHGDGHTSDSIQDPLRNGLQRAGNHSPSVQSQGPPATQECLNWTLGTRKRR